MPYAASPFAAPLLARAGLPADLNALYEQHPALAQLAYRLNSAESTYRDALQRAADVISRELNASEQGRMVNALGVLQSTGLRVDTAAATLATLQEVFGEALSALTAARETA